MAISVTITNLTGSTVGPYNGVSLAGNASLTVTSQIPSFAYDTSFISDLFNNNVSLQIGSINFAANPDIGLSLFQAIAGPQPWTYSNLTGNATTTIKSSLGILHGIIINNNTTGGVVKVYDNTAGSGTLIATVTCGSPTGGLLSATGAPGPVFVGSLDLAFSTGLTIVTSGSSSNNVTILWQ